MGINECKRALDDAGGDLETATLVLRERGIDVAVNKIAKGRPMTEGVIETYLHYTKRMAVIVEVNCETDFVAGTEEFKVFARDVARWIAMERPADVDALLQAQIHIGSTWLGTVEQRLLEVVAKVGESIQIRRFHVYELGAE